VSVVPERRRRRAEINIVPLVDVLVTLIFFFLVSMQFRDLHALNITFPKIETAGENIFMDQIEVAVSAEGEFYFNGVRMDRDELRRSLETAAEFAGETPVLVMADEESRLRDVTMVMDFCRKVGLERIRLQSR